MSFPLLWHKIYQTVDLLQVDLLSGLFTLISLFKRAPASEPIGNVALLVDSVELGGIFSLCMVMVIRNITNY